MLVTAYWLAQRYIGLAEVAGETSNSYAIMDMLRRDQSWPKNDETPWCSAFVNHIAWLLRLPRSKSLRARSWLQVGEPVKLEDAEPGFDVVILKRGSGEQPGPEVINAPGHVGFFGGLEKGVIEDRVMVLGGNQKNSVNVTSYPIDRVLGVRRLSPPLP